MEVFLIIIVVAAIVEAIWETPEEAACTCGAVAGRARLPG